MTTTYDDAKLVVGLLQWASQINLNDAIGVVSKRDFDPESAETSDPHVRGILGFFEVVATFVKRGVLDRDFVHDLFAIAFVWSRVGPAALRARAEIGEPRLFENFEALANTVPATV